MQLLCDGIAKPILDALGFGKPAGGGPLKKLYSCAQMGLWGIPTIFVAQSIKENLRYRVRYPEFALHGRTMDRHSRLLLERKWRSGVQVVQHTSNTNEKESFLPQFRFTIFWSSKPKYLQRLFVISNPLRLTPYQRYTKGPRPGVGSG